MATGSTTVAIEAKKDHTYEITIIGALFFIFGFVTWVNGSLMAYLQVACQLTNLETSFVTSAFFISYFVMGIPSGLVLKKTGYKRGMIYGLLVMAAGALIFIPAASTRTYGGFLTGLFVIGTGMALLQTAANPYATVLGPIESAARRISIMGICNKVAGGIGTFILGSILFVNIDGIKTQIPHLSHSAKEATLNELASRVVVPYIAIAVVLILVAIMVALSKLPEIDTDREDEALQAHNSQKKSVFQFPNLVLGFITLFFYVGVEVIAGDTIIKFGNSQNIPLAISKYFTILTLLAMVVGYIIGIILMPKYIKQDKALLISAVLGLLFTSGVILTSGSVAIFFLAMLGFANAIMYPALWPLALDGLGRFTKIASALMIMAIVGGGVIPPLLLTFFDTFPAHTQYAYWIALPCYALILYYAAVGHKLRKWAQGIKP